MNKEDKKLQKHLVDEMMKVSKTNPDVMTYMQILMENYEKQEQKILELQQELLNKKLNVKNIEYKEKMIYKERIDKAIEYIKEWQSFPHTNGSTHNELRNLLSILE